MKTSESTIQVRIDKKTKDAARKTLDEMGLDISSAVKMFLRNVVITQSIPLNLRTENGFTVAQEQDMIRDTEEAIKHGKRYDSVDELFAEWDKL